MVRRVIDFHALWHATHLFSLAFPESMTKVTSGIVMPVSAMFVAMTIFRVPDGGTVKAADWSDDDSTEWRAIIRYLQATNVMIFIACRIRRSRQPVWVREASVSSQQIVEFLNLRESRHENEDSPGDVTKLLRRLNEEQDFL